MATPSATVPPIKVFVCHVCKEVTFDDLYSHQVTPDKKITCCTKSCFNLYQSAFFRNWEAKQPKDKPKPKPVNKGHKMGNTNSNIQKIQKNVNKQCKK